MTIIETVIKMVDKASPTINKINTALNKANAHCQKLHNSSKKIIEPTSIQKANLQLTQTANKFAQIGANIKLAALNLKQNFIAGLQNASVFVSGLLDKVKALSKAFAAIAVLGLVIAVKKSIDFIKKSIENAKIQANAEIQLSVTLSNSGSNAKTFDEIKKKAAQIQKRGMFGDEAMISGASEFAKNLKDSAAITKMMDTLADYAISMSNGEKVDASGMKSYATSLAKVMNGTYTSLERQNFKISEAQKAVIKGTATQSQYIQVLGKDYQNMSKDMQKVAVISQVIENRVGGMYDALSNTPTGRMTQLQNALSDISEKAGAILGPHVTEFFNTLIKYLPQIEAITLGISKALSVVLDVLNSVIDVAGQAVAYIQKHWSEINVVVYSLGAALAVLMLSLNPILFLIIAIIAVLAQTVKMINKTTGQSISTIGIIAGAVAWLGSLIWNTIAVAWNFIAIFIEWLVNIVKHPLISAKIALNNLTAYILDFAANITSIFDGIATNIANAMISAINFIIRAWNSLIDIFGPIDFFGIKFNKGKELSKIDSITASIRATAESYRQEAENIKPDDYWTIPRMGFIDTSNAYNSGYNWGASLGSKINDTIKGFFPDGTDESDDLDEIANNTGNTASNTGALKDALSATDEDLKYLREFAEREAINKFTTAQIKVEMTNNNSISSEMDIDGVVNVLTQTLNEQLATQVEGVYA